ncbi:MAG TPA: SnoaL-like domain-containing protein [Opitutaceae bacterium]|nr:SnoaL-like domain-containing protein [Opitutaceae bacterium]
MNTQQIAHRLAAHCRKGEWEAAQKELFANDAVSIEQEDMPGFSKETKGLKAIIDKGHKWAEMVESVHLIEVGEPVVAGDAIAMRLRLDSTMKGRGRMDMAELCVYETKDGKIVSERFFS